MDKLIREDLWPEGLRRTDSRVRVLNVLADATRPLSVMEICSEIERRYEPVWVSSVYRALETFTEHDLIEQSVMPGSDAALYVLKRHEHKHYASCLDCHRRIPLDDCAADVYADQLKQRNFSVIDHHIELYGYCENCAPKHKGETHSHHH